MIGGDGRVCQVVSMVISCRPSRANVNIPHEVSQAEWVLMLPGQRRNLGIRYLMVVMVVMVVMQVAALRAARRAGRGT